VSTKEQIVRAIADLPDDAKIEDALDRLYLMYKVEKGLKQADRGELLTTEVVRHRLSQWLQ
jgi:predicted transcriptional regulator